MVISRGTKELFADVAVNTTWITSMLRSQMMSPDDAKKLYMSSATNIAHNLSNLEAWTEAQNKELSEDEIQMAAVLESTWKPVRTYPVVTEWVDTFSLTAAKPRRKVL
eukprot:12906928-Prorocentrum_lima.AAC.1